MNHRDERTREGLEGETTGPEKLTAECRGSISTNAPRLRLSWWRLVFKNWRWCLASSMATAIFLGGISAGICFMVQRLSGAGVIVLLLSLPFLLIAIGTWLFTGLLVRRDTVAVSSGLLTPGIVSPDGRRLYCLANISHDEEDDYHGLQGVLFRPRAGETEVPCASVFADGKTHPHWEGFTPVPLRWGCGDAEAIDACRQRIGDEHWEMLRTAVRQLNVPPVGHMLVLNGKLEPLTVLDDIGHEVSSEALDGKSTTGVSYGALTAGALFIALGILVVGLGAMLFTLPFVGGSKSPPLQELVPLLMLPSFGLVAIATGLCLRNRLWGSATILILLGGCLGIVYGVFASMQR